MPVRLETAACTDIGRRRRENQDRSLVAPALGLFAVADGMGGMPYGSEAAEATLAALEEGLRQQPPASVEDWRRLVHDLNRKVVAIGQRLSPHLGIGSTLTALHAGNGAATVVHVGDSAAFRLRGAEWLQLTSEHTVGARERQRRPAGHRPGPPTNADHILTSCVGASSLEEIDVLASDLCPGDRYLLCSDGITKTTDSAAIRSALAQATTPALAAEALVALANDHGGPDNATAVVIFCSQ